MGEEVIVSLVTNLVNIVQRIAQGSIQSSAVMNEKDLHPFISTYRDDVEKVTLRMKNGLGSSRNNPADYKRLQAFVDAKRQESDVIGQKVQKIQCAAKATKESSILRQHRQVWSRECPRLQKAEEKAENDLHDFLEQMRPSSTTDTAIFSLKDYELFLAREQDAFREATVQPVHQLREDLLFRLGEVGNRQLNVRPSNWEQVIQQIEFVKDQQEDITAKLHWDYVAAEDEIKSLGLEKYLTSTSDTLVDMGSVPEEVFSSDCPYPELKDSLIQAFLYMSERYQSRLHSLQEQLQGTDRFYGWSPDDHLRFQFTLLQYTHGLPNHRALCTDMLHRLFPEKSRRELMDHERAWDWQHFTQVQMNVVTQQWQRDQEALLARALVTLQEATHAHQEELEHHRDRQNQQEICSHLREKLQRWRAQQEEVAKLEAAVAERQQAEGEARLKREQEKEATTRSQQKEKVKQFCLKREKKREEQEHRDQERLANLRRAMGEQARRDKERVQFRADVLQRRLEEREARELERQREEEEKQNRLEALRNQVEVVAEADPERMMADTEAWKSRLLNVKECEPRKPLYSINTYTDKQIVSDPRVRVEQALREAGLHQSQYAKEVLSTIKPPKSPRRDTKSVLKF